MSKFADRADMASNRIINLGAPTAAADAATKQYVDNVAGSGLVPVASQAERDAIVGADGKAVWRKDRDRIEVHDGTAWRAQSVPVVSSVPDLGSITSPVAGSVAYNTADNQLYAYVSGAWRRANWGESWGVIGGKSYSSGSAAGIGANETLTGIDTGTLTLLAGRRYAWTVRFVFLSSGNSADYWQFALHQTNLAGPGLGSYVFWTDQNVMGITGWWQAERDVTTATTDTWVMSANRLTGPDTLTVYKQLFNVRDLGPSGRLTAVP